MPTQVKVKYNFHVLRSSLGILGRHLFLLFSKQCMNPRLIDMGSAHHRTSYILTADGHTKWYHMVVDTSTCVSNFTMVLLPLSWCKPTIFRPQTHANPSLPDVIIFIREIVVESFQQIIVIESLLTCRLQENKVILILLHRTQWLLVLNFKICTSQSTSEEITSN